MKKLFITILLISSLLLHAAAERDYSRIPADLRSDCENQELVQAVQQREAECNQGEEASAALDAVPEAYAMERKKHYVHRNNLMSMPHQLMSNVQILSNPFLIAQDKVSEEPEKKEEGS